MTCPLPISTACIYTRAQSFHRCGKRAFEAYIEEYHYHFGLECTE